MIELCAEFATCPADRRPQAEWIDVTNLLRDGAIPQQLTNFTKMARFSMQIVKLRGVR